ncbi:M14 family zinc carboxypeptidase [Paenibacillus caseinilyticus]|uniref:Peptidase M14 n=1 Tax=Paenibacillus mucilaginosus K02 TaxID=997761 RepID=I0BEZ7_9BACL|nr:M14 family zinc carboxypeptidase [Paenibacillus mucilaginosus]AFH60944.1 peptidase M14 [Paenibacillus mucilaginosus K02]
MTFPYVVRRGDTLGRISARYGTDPASLCGANPQLGEGGALSPGQVIQIPVRPVKGYAVQAGDTYAGVAARFRLTVEELTASNPEADPRRLRIGQTLIIPQAGPVSAVDCGRPYGYTEMMEDLSLLGRMHPFLEITSLGRSVMGREIPLVRIGSGPKEVHYNASFHANEWITSLLLMRFLEAYAGAYADGLTLQGQEVRTLLQSTTLWLVPMVNPDGVELVLRGAAPDHPYYSELLEYNGGSCDFSGWKANIRGVDLNDQFPAHWEAERDRRDVPGPGPRDYTGAAPLTEPEAAAMAAFTRSRPLALVMAFHTQGRELYWNYRDLEPPEAEALAERLALCSGYRAVKLTGSDAGYKDWFIQEFRRPGFTIEAGFGVNPLPLSQFPRIYDELLPLMLEGLRL